MSETQNTSSVYVAKQSELFFSENKGSEDGVTPDEVFNADKDRLAVIEASAGTGKTFALVELVLELLLEQEIPLKSILLVTSLKKPLPNCVCVCVQSCGIYWKNVNKTKIVPKLFRK